MSIKLKCDDELSGVSLWCPTPTTNSHNSVTKIKKISQDFLYLISKAGLHL